MKSISNEVYTEVRRLVGAVGKVAAIKYVREQLRDSGGPYNLKKSRDLVNQILDDPEKQPPTKYKVCSLEQLHNLVSHKRSVYCPTITCFRKPLPAAFVINMAGSVIFKMIQRGMYVYQKGES